MHHEQDIRKMGGLRSAMPKTYFIFLIGLLAISGIPPLSGFFSKDEILWSAFSSPHGSTALWAVGFLTALLTAFYMTRLFSLTFLGKPRWVGGHDHGHDNHGHDHDHGHAHTPHESPWVMVGPLLLLSLLSAVGGFLGIPHMSWIGHWLGGVIPEHEAAEGINHSMEWVLMGVSVVGAALSMFLAFRAFRDPGREESIKKKMGALYTTLSNKWYVDEFYDFILVRPFVATARGLWKGFDVFVIDRVVIGAGKTSMWMGETLRVLQTGSTQIYLGFFALGLALVLGVLVYGLV
jgi:NADH-quinone oxidoreductase subunit L